MKVVAKVRKKDVEVRETIHVGDHFIDRIVFETSSRSSLCQGCGGDIPGDTERITVWENRGFGFSPQRHHKTCYRIKGIKKLIKESIRKKKNKIGLLQSEVRSMEKLVNNVNAIFEGK